MADGARERILGAAYACVARYGMAKTTVEDAARAAKLSQATVYRYFPGGKEQLLRETRHLGGGPHLRPAGWRQLSMVCRTSPPCCRRR